MEERPQTVLTAVLNCTLIIMAKAVKEGHSESWEGIFQRGGCCTIKKLLSRKFILALVAAVFSVILALSGAGGEIGTVCSVVAAFIAPITYVLTEGRLDAKALEMISESAKEASKAISPNDGE